METTKIEHVSDTALWVAHYRAVESERPDALFKDPMAKVLVGDRGRSIAENMKATSSYVCWHLAIRTHVIDRYIQKLVGEGIDLVLNLGAGLDTRPYRLPLPQSLQWIEVDYPHMIAHKEKLLAGQKPVCRLERVSLDLADSVNRERLLAEVAGKAKKILVITEGVIPYLTESQVKDLGAGLHKHRSYQFWIGEFFGKRIYEHLKNPRRMARMENAPFQFFPDDWYGLFRNVGWAPREVEYLAEESIRIGRRIPAPWWFFIFWIFRNTERAKQYRQSMGYVLFQRA